MTFRILLFAGLLTGGLGAADNSFFAPANGNLKALTQDAVNRGIEDALLGKAGKLYTKAGEKNQDSTSSEFYRAMASSELAKLNRGDLSHVCAIPLLTAKATPSAMSDHIGRPVGSAKFDDIARPAPVPACNESTTDRPKP